MTRLAYDHQIFSRQRFGGVSRYYVELAARVAADPEFEAAVVAPIHMNALLAERQEVPVVGVYVRHLHGTGALRSALNAGITRVHFRRSRPDIVHETYFGEKSVAPRGVQTVVTVFDMIHELFPQFFHPGDLTARRKRAAVQRASQVICISESTRHDLLDHVQIDPARVSVVPLGASSTFVQDEGRQRSVPAPYVLYVGQRDGYKNFKSAAAAFAESGLPALGMKLVCFGGGPWSARDGDAVSSTGLPNSIVIRRHGDDAALAELYQNAEAFLYPSLYEGFGIPPLEAMMCGCPVICSGASSLPEVVGNAAELFDPADVHDIARALGSVVGNSARSGELRQLGTRRASLFSWSASASRTKEIYRRLV